MTCRIRSIFLGLAVVLSLAGPAAAQTTRPTVDELELAGTNAFNAGDYEAALPLLEKTAAMVKDDANRSDRLREWINVCKENLVTVDIDAARKDIKNVPRPTKPLPSSPDVPSAADTRVPHAPPKDGEVRQIGIKELGNFEYDPEKGGFPADVQALSGLHVRVRGFMIPMTAAEKIEEFAFVVDVMSCCFGKPPGIQHMIQVHTPAGKAVRYYGDLIVVEGVLKVNEKREDGYTIGLFELDAESVKPAPN